MTETETKSICSILSWTIITIDKIVEIYNEAEDRRDLLPEFGEAYRGLPFIRVALKKVEDGIKSDSEDVPESLRDALKYAKGCQQSSLRLEAMFRRVLPRAGVARLKHPPISRMDQYRMALDTYGDDFLVPSLLNRLSEDTQQLAKCFPKETEAEDLNKLAERQQAIQATKPSVPLGRRDSQIALSNWGSGHMNTNVGSGSQYTNDRGHQYNAKTQIFGSDARGQDPFEALRQEKTECFSSLRYENLNTRRNRLEEERAHTGTCDWLFESTQFQQWQHRRNLESHNGVLWIKGKPGTGKSTLMMHNVSYCEKEFRDHVICAHFFSARGDSNEKSPLGLWRSLVYQMLEKEPLLYDRFIPLFRKKPTKVWTEDELRRFLRSQMSSAQPKPFLFLIDALDECDDYSAGRVVDFLAELSDLAVQKGVSLNVCISSRYYPEIRFEKCIDLFVDQRKEHDQDIEQYVRDKLPEDLSLVREEIINKANGVFLWVVLVITMLKKKDDTGRRDEMEQVVNRIPSGLDELFIEILNKDESNKAETIMMFQLVLFAKRLLKPEELYFATIAGTRPVGLGPWDQSLITTPVIRRRIRDVSRGLIEVLDNENTVQFIHLSVSDFLSRKNRLHIMALPPSEEDSNINNCRKVVASESSSWWSKLSSFYTTSTPVENNAPMEQNDVVSSSNSSIARCCMAYLTKSVQSPVKSESEHKELEGQHPFLKYSSTYLLDHAENAELHGHAQESVIDWLLGDEKAFETFRSIHNRFERMPGLLCFTGASLIHMLAFHGHHNLLKLILQRGVDVNAQFGYLNSAIQIASEKGDTTMVSLLLEHGADTNLSGGMYGNALQAASKEDRREVVALLLNNGARINAQCGVYGTALQAAAEKGAVETVRLLLDNGADVNIRAGFLGTPLQAACYGSQEVAKILLECGADPHANCGHFGTALQAAATGHKPENDIIGMLIEKGVDVNAQGGFLCTALQAAMGGTEITVKLLLEKGADTTIGGGFYGSILHRATEVGTTMTNMIITHSYSSSGENSKFIGAAWAGDITTVEQMVEYGQDVNAEQGLLGTALQAASWSGEEKMVEKLLELGADIDLCSGTYGTALQAASAESNYRIVKMLIDKGANIHTPGGLFGNALQAAAYSGDVVVFKHLLDNGANINAEGGHWGNALEAAATKERSAIVDLLIKKGVNVRMQGGIYGTALHAAAWSGSTHTVKTLLDNGADVNAQAGIMKTALQAAGQVDIAEILLEHGADINLRGGVLGAPLDGAVVERERDRMDLLIRHGAHPNPCNRVWSRPDRWNLTYWWARSAVWKPASGIMISMCILSFAGWRYWNRFSVLWKGSFLSA